MQEEVETVLKAAAQLRPLALLYESKCLFSSALQVWQTLALENSTMDLHMVAASEAARLLESSSDSGLVLQHTGWVSSHLSTTLVLILIKAVMQHVVTYNSLVLLCDGYLIGHHHVLW